jgi:hypothetical protein
MPLSTYQANRLLDGEHGGSFTKDSPTYFAAMTATPTVGGGGTEVTGGSYARVSFTNNSTNWPAASSGQKLNGTTINFGTASADWGTITTIAEYDASSGGNLLSFGALTTPITVLNGQSFSIPVGAAVFTKS